MNEVERARIADLVSRAAASATDQPSPGGPVLCRTIRIATYPTSAQAFYGVIRARVAATAVEGSTPSFTNEAADRAFLAANCGAKVPPENTLVIVHQEGGGFVFRYG